MNLPKVLVIGQPFNNVTGSGITQTNFFEGWDKDKLAVASVGYLFNHHLNTQICSTYYQLGEEELSWKFPFNLIKRKYTSGVVDTSSFATPVVYSNKRKLRTRFILKVFYPFLETTGLFLGVKKAMLSARFKNWVKDFDPDVIYAQAGERDRYLFCIAAQQFLQKPMVFHIMDDWPTLVVGTGAPSLYWKKVINSELRQLFSHSALLMSICQEMTREYRSRYNQKFVPFHNPVELRFWKPYQKTSYKLSKTITILYAGRIGLGINSSLKLMAAAIHQLNSDMNLNIQLVLQTEDKPKWLNDFPCISHKDFVAYSDLPKLFSLADFLLLPYDFSVKALKFIKYSMPTKASEYMITGTPIIVFAPAETALAKYASEHNWAKVISNNSQTAILTALWHLIENEAERKTISTNAKKLAENNHDSNLIRQQFREVICSLKPIPSKKLN